MSIVEGAELSGVGAIEAVWRERRTSLVATVAAITGDRDGAVEAVDEAFTRAIQRRSRVEAMASPSGWILKVALNVVRSTKSRGTRRHLAEAAVVRAPSAGWVEPADPRFELWAAVAQLPDRERAAIALRYLGDLSEPQIAQVMGVAVGTVGASLTSARRKLARQLRIEVPVTDQEGRER